MSNAHPLVSEQMVEAAARILCAAESGNPDAVVQDVYDPEDAGRPAWMTWADVARQVLNAIAPLLCAAQRERDARIAEEQPYFPDTKVGKRQQWVKDQIAVAIRGDAP